MSNIKSEIDKWYENYIDELFAYGIAFGVEKDFVLDAIHDLFLHLFESADKIEILGSPKSYLFSALKNKIITSLRKQANWLSLDEEVEYDQLIDKNKVDLTALFQGALALALPLVVLCSEDCAGLCPQCGTNLNHETCNCAAQQEIDPQNPFAVLKNYRFDSEE